MLKVGGENVAAIEIESFLATHPAIKLAQVVGVPDARLIEVPAAFVELAPGAALTEEEMIASARADRGLQGAAPCALRRRVADVGDEGPEVPPARRAGGRAQGGR